MGLPCSIHWRYEIFEQDYLKLRSFLEVLRVDGREKLKWVFYKRSLEIFPGCNTSCAFALLILRMLSNKTLGVLTQYKLSLYLATDSQSINIGIL